MALIIKKIKNLLSNPYNFVVIMFGFEGFFLQFVMSINGSANNLYASYLGATDGQLGLVHVSYTVVTLILLMPVGIIANKLNSSKKLLIIISLLTSAMFFCLATIPPMLTQGKMLFFFVFLGLGMGLVSTYNAQWQSFFGDIVEPEHRNDVYIVRNRFTTVVGVAAPALFGFVMGYAVLSSDKLLVTRCFYYANAVMMILLSFFISKIKEPERLKNDAEEKAKFSVKNLGLVFREMIKNKNFMTFFGVTILFYLFWHMDWSMWYISQTKYCGFTGSTLGYYNALMSVIQLLCLGFWGKVNKKRGVSYTMIFCSFSIALAVVGVIISVLSPMQYRFWVFVLVAVIAAFPQAGFAMAIVQLVLENVPVKNRPVIISIYTMATTLSNCFMPLIGVKLYTAYGANEAALIKFYITLMFLRLIPAVLYLLRYLSMKKRNVIS